MDYRLEVVVIPVSDVDRAKAFYQGLGWRLDADFATGPDFRVVQVTPVPKMTAQADPGGVSCTTRKSGPVAKSASSRHPSPW